MSRAMSPEIKALRAIDRALQSVPYETHRRILEWAWDRFVLRPPKDRPKASDAPREE